MKDSQIADYINSSVIVETPLRRKDMRISTQNLFWMNTARGQKSLNQLLPGAVRTADARRALEQKEITEKASALTRNGEEKRIDIGLENTGTAAPLSAFIVAKGDVPVKAAQKIEEFYQAAGSLTNSVTYKEARLRYLQSEYEKIADSGSKKRADKLKELMEEEYRDMAEILEWRADLMDEGFRNSDAVYGKLFGEEFRTVLGEIPDRIRSIADSLKGTDNMEEALEYLASAKEQLLKLADGLKTKYQGYTGQELAGYEYSSEDDFAGVVKSYGLLWNFDEVTVDTANMQNLADYGVDINNLSAIPEAVNLIDTKA